VGDANTTATMSPTANPGSVAAVASIASVPVDCDESSAKAYPIDQAPALVFRNCTHDWIVGDGVADQVSESLAGSEPSTVRDQK
jgi:hypothetical protein